MFNEDSLHDEVAALFAEMTQPSRAAMKDGDQGYSVISLVGSDKHARKIAAAKEKHRFGRALVPGKSIRSFASARMVKGGVA